MQGKSFGNYEMRGLLGRGGMGEVHRAHDTRLGRDVAIKVLPREFIADANRLARFEREARVLASLNHPSIAAVYGLEKLDDQQCLILELAQGETLAERIDRGALPLDDAIDIARQIAEGVQAAHDRGVMHRDLKPANIKITPDGTVKILDFGLAKALSPEAGESDASHPRGVLADSPTMTHQLSSAGLLLGTAGYMSPEQAKGKAVDARTDVWAFGCVLYEMLTGAPTFPGETLTDVLAAVVTRDPDWERLPPGLPTPLRRLLRRCFVRDRQQRLQHIGDARLELQDALAGAFAGESVPATGAVVSAQTRPGLFPLALTAIGALSLGALLMWALDRSAAEPAGVRQAYSIILDHPLKEGGLAARSFDLSRDGRMLVYTGMIGPASNLYLRSMDDWEIREIPGTDGAGDPVFSPDARWVLYTAAGRLLRVAVSGGQPIVVSSVPGIPYGIDVSDDESIVFTTNLSDGFFIVEPDGSLRDVPVGERKGLFRWPEVLPGGRTVLGALTEEGGTRRIVAVNLQTGEVLRLMPGTHPRYLPTGHLIYKQEETVLVVPFDPGRVETTGKAYALPFQVGEWQGAMWLSTSDAGHLVYMNQLHASNGELVWVDREGRSTPALDQRGDYYAPRVSPDSGRLLWSSAISPLGDIWVHDIRRNFSSRLSDQGFDAYPTWLPDGQRFVYSSDKGGAFELFVQLADRADGGERLLETPNADIPTSVAADGTIFFYQVHAETQRDILAVRPDGTVETLVKERHNERGPSVSPDGRWFAYVSDEGGQDEIYVQPYPTTGQRWRISTEGGAEPRWAPDGSAIYFRNGDGLFEAQVRPGSSLSADPPRVLFRGPYVLDAFGNPGYDVAPDGRFLMVRGEAAKPATLQVVVNWSAGLDRQERD